MRFTTESEKARHAVTMRWITFNFVSIFVLQLNKSITVINVWSLTSKTFALGLKLIQNEPNGRLFKQIEIKKKKNHLFHTVFTEKFFSRVF